MREPESLLSHFWSRIESLVTVFGTRGVDGRGEAVREGGVNLRKRSLCAMRQLPWASGASWRSARRQARTALIVALLLPSLVCCCSRCEVCFHGMATRDTINNLAGGRV